MDLQLFQIINGLVGKNIWLDSFLIFCAEYLIFGLVLVLIFLFFTLKEKKKKIQLLILALSSSILSWLLGQLISLIYFRPRPFVEQDDIIQLIQHVQDKSFPSDHAVIAFVLGLSIYLFNKKLGVLALIGAFLISFARIFSGIHYPSDVLGGVIIASLIILGVWKIVKSWTSCPMSNK